MIGASLLAVTLLTASFAMHEVAYAKETSVNISGKQYELAEKSKYDYDDGTTPTIISSSVENNRCDQLAVAAANDRAHLLEDTGYVPGSGE